LRGLGRAERGRNVRIDGFQLRGDRDIVLRQKGGIFAELDVSGDLGARQRVGRGLRSQHGELRGLLGGFLTAIGEHGRGFGGLGAKSRMRGGAEIDRRGVGFLLLDMPLQRDDRAVDRIVTVAAG
jgi:hypothetical protein